MSGARQSIAWAALSVGCVLLWQGLTVRNNYAGNWTALFCTGAGHRIPPALAPENIRVFPGSDGFDGQFYHYIAHDPFLRRGMAEFIDAPRLRYRRILVPLAAFLLAGGNDSRVDTAYAAVILVFLFLGAWCLGRLTVPPAALLFVLTPAAIWSFDRMVVDGALLALTLAFCLYSQSEDRPASLFLVLSAAALVRETGLILVAAFVLWQLSRRRVGSALRFAAAALPAFAWYAYVASRTAPGTGLPFVIPFSGLLHRLLHPVTYPFSPGLAALVQSLDYLALAGIVLAFTLAFRRVAVIRTTPRGIAALLFVALGILSWRAGDWGMPIDYTRVFSPLFLLLAVEPPRAAAPLLLNIPRCLLQLGPQALAILKSLADRTS